MSAISDSTKLKTLNLTIEGMACTGCAGRCRQVLLDLGGIRKVGVSYEKGEATIRYHPDSIGENGIIQRIEETGFNAEKKGK